MVVLFCEILDSFLVFSETTHELNMHIPSEKNYEQLLVLSRIFINKIGKT